ncbi:TonB-dependent receptor [Colwellia asteriadis]|uniref:TonB-dependent receptor n=2 Tax=Colwellia asteriadis TaxID=517723 RepID=A0ABN1LBB0_9GAMM
MSSYGFSEEIDEDREQLQSIEVITVHGEKTERSLKDTASSVSVIAAEQLATGQYLSVSSAVSEIPNVVVLTGSAPDIRGVSGNGAASGFNSFTGGAKTRVATLVDGVAEPFVADLTGDTGLWDIEQIEVFRGPQSTSNGRNSIAGSVFIKTKDPTFDWDAAARLGYRDQEQYIDSAFMVSGPLIDKTLAFRLSGENIDGETYKNANEFENNPPKFDQNEVKSNRLRTKLLWQPQGDDNLQVMLSHNYNHEQGNTGRNYYVADKPWDYKPIFERYMDTQASTTSLNFDYQLSTDKSFDLLLSYMDYDWSFQSYEPDPAAEYFTAMNDKNYTLDGKFNFGLDSSSVTGFIGLAYFKREQKFSSVGAYGYDGDDSSSSLALYGEVSFAINNSFTLIAGGRLESEEQQRNFNMQFSGQDIHENLDKDNEIFLPKLVLQYKITDDTTLSASARQGYNAGGGALALVESEYYYYDEELVNTYELSSRSSFNNINLSANLFYNDFDGYQAANSLRRITNIDEAQSLGFELEASAMLSEDFELRAGFGLLSTEITEADPAFGDVIGNELNSAPKFTGNIGIKYWLSDELTMALAGNYVDKYYGDFNNTSERVAGDYFLTRFNIDYVVENWRVSAFVNNMFDEQALTVQDPPSRGYEQGYAAIVDPRNIGISVTYSM